MICTTVNNSLIIKDALYDLSIVIEKHNLNWLNMHIQFVLDSERDVGMIAHEDAVADLCRYILMADDQHSEDLGNPFAAASRLIKEGGVVVTKGRFHPGSLFLPYKPENDDNGADA